MQTSLPEFDDRSLQLLKSWGVELNPEHPFSSKLPHGWCWVPGNFNDRLLQDPQDYYRASYYGKVFVFPYRYRITGSVKRDRKTLFDYRYAIVQDRAKGLKQVTEFKGFAPFFINKKWGAIEDDGGVYEFQDGEFIYYCDRTDIPVNPRRSARGFDPSIEWKAAYDRLVFRKAKELCDQLNSEANWEIV